MATGMILNEKIKVKKAKEEGCVTTLEIEVPASQVQDMTHNVWLLFQTQARLPGFRQGKAPLSMIQQQFAGEAKERVLQRLLEKAIPEALKEQNLHPVATPGVHDIKMDAGKPLSFKVDVECAPKVEAKNYKKLAATRNKYPATDEEINKRVAELREGNARLEKAKEEAVGKEHYVVADYQASMDGRPVKDGKGVDELIDMASPQSVEGLTEGLLGAKRGETRDVAVKIEGRKGSFNVTVKEIKTKVLPNIDDDFAKDLGFQTLDELKKNLKELIEKEGAHRSERELTQQVEEALLKSNRFPVPPTLAENQLERLAERVQEQIIGPNRQLPEEEAKKLREKLAPRAEDEVRLSFLFRAIAVAEKIEVAPTDIQTELDRNLAEAGTDEQKRGLRKFFEEHQEQIASMIRDRKVLAFLKTNAAIKDA